MKLSPFTLDFVVYPSFTFDSNPNYKDGMPSKVIIPAVEAEVIYRFDGGHFARLNLSFANEQEDHPYSFELHVLSNFTFDRELAIEAYKQSAPRVMAVNVARVLYSGAREFLANATARGPFGSLMLQSMMLEPGDVKIQSDRDEKEVKAHLFGSDLETGTEQSVVTREKITVQKKVISSKKK